MDAKAASFVPLLPAGPPSLTYQVETLDAVMDELLRLIEFHYEEIAQFKKVQKLDPDWGSYQTLEKAGKLWIMTVRDRGVMVGYMFMIVGTALHYKSLVVASEDVHYLLPQYRRGLTGYRLLKNTREAMKQRGAGLMLMRTKAEQSHAPLFERLDGKLSDLVYAFEL